MEDDLNFSGNGRRPQIFTEREDDLIFSENENDSYFRMYKGTSIFQEMEDDINLFRKRKTTPVF